MIPSRTLLDFFVVTVVLALGGFGWLWLGILLGDPLVAVHPEFVLVVGLWLLLYVFVVVNAYKVYWEAIKLDRLTPAERGEYLNTAWALPVAIIGGTIILGGVALWVWQIGFWLYTGAWVSLDPVTLFELASDEARGPQTLLGPWEGGEFAQWLADPEQWVGLSLIVRFLLSWIPVPLFLILFSSPAIEIHEELIQKREKLERKQTQERTSPTAETEEN